MSKENYAFIDGNNLYLGAKNQNISIDYKKFRTYLENKYGVAKAIIFIGYSPERIELYKSLRKDGYDLVFKPTIQYIDSAGRKTMKGNVDAELVLHTAAIEFDNYKKAIIVTGDGDFACLMDYLEQKDKLKKLITPAKKYSLLLRPFSKFILPLKTISKQVSR